jgi:deoxynucleoside triphosphate triphosphohydrolase SAMHD1
MNYKVINDTIHGQIALSKIAIQIIDTPVFQRLRNIKQLGACSYVFPTAQHSRFEHSIGVAHLAKEFLRNLVLNSENINVKQEDYLLVEIAGLCHDLGHGPFSHTFDNEIIKNKYNKEENKYVEHEERSCMLLRYTVNKYNIALSSVQLDNIIEMIHPMKETEDKSFIYSIVCNVKNSLDVDKIDYIERDITNLAIGNGYTHSRLFKMCKVVDNQICIHKKEAFNVYEFFRLRYRLHKQIYNHPAVKAHEYMIADILQYLDPILKISDSIDNPSEFVKFTDSILDVIEFLPETDDILKAKQLLDNIKCRKLYKLFGEFIISNKEKYLCEKKKLLNILKKKNIEKYLIIHELNIGLSGSDINPIKNIIFYDNKNNNIHIEPTSLSPFICDNIKEFSIRFFIKNIDYEKEINKELHIFKRNMLIKET